MNLDFQLLRYKYCSQIVVLSPSDLGLLDTAAHGEYLSALKMKIRTHNTGWIGIVFVDQWGN